MLKLTMKLVVLLGLLPMAAKAMLFLASYTTVTATVTNPEGHAWANGTWTAELVVPTGMPSGTVVTAGGVSVSSSRNGTLDANGLMNATLTDTRSLDQPGVMWKITVCPNTNSSDGADCASYTTATTESTLDLTSKFHAETAARLPAKAVAVPPSASGVGDPGGNNCNLQYKVDATTFGGDTGSCTDGSGNITVTSLVGKFVSLLGMGKQWRSTSTSTDGCQNAYAEGAVTCITEPGYTNDAGIVTNTTYPTVRSVDTSYAGQAEVIQNAQAYGITIQSQWTKRYLYYADNRMPQPHAGAYDTRPLGQQEYHYFSNRGRDENNGPSQWSVGAARNSYMQSNGEGIRQHDTTNTVCYSLGDCMWHYGYLVYAGGSPEGSAEGYRGWAQHVTEQNGDVQTTIASVVSSTVVRLTTSGTGYVSGNGTQGVGRYLVDKNGTAVYSGNITGATFSGTYGLISVTVDASMTVSPWIGQGATSVVAAVNMDSPALAAITLTTAYGDAANLANGDHMCIASTNSTSAEEVVISSLSVSGTSVTFSSPLRHGHSGNTTAAKGPCYALDATGLHLKSSAGTMNALMVIGFPGASGATTTNTMLVGTWFLGSAQGPYSTILNSLTHSCSGTFSQSGTTVTATITSSPYCTQYFANNPAVTVTGTTDFNGVPPTTPVYNGNVATSVLTWTVSTSATIAAEAGTITTTNTSSAFNVWPMAVIFNVCDPSVTTAPTLGQGANLNPCVNGYMDLETNSVAWGASDPVEIPHYNVGRANGGFLNLSQDTYAPGGYSSGFVVQAYGEGWGGAPLIDTQVADSNYLGTGGRMVNPPVAFRFRGPNIQTIVTNAPTVPNNGTNSAVVYVNCATIGTYSSGYNCAKTPEYYFAQFTSTGGYNGITFDPQSSTIGFNTIGVIKSNAPYRLWATTTGIGSARLPLVGNLFYDTTTNHAKVANNAAAFGDLAYLSEVCTTTQTGNCPSTSVTYSNVTSSRAYATNYTNSTGHRIKVLWTGTDVSGSHAVQLACYVDGNDVAWTEVGATTAGGKFTVECDVANGSIYQVTTTSSGGFTAATIAKVLEEAF